MIALPVGHQPAAERLKECQSKAADPDALLPSIPDKAFKGKL